MYSPVLIYTSAVCVPSPLGCLLGGCLSLWVAVSRVSSALYYGVDFYLVLLLYVALYWLTLPSTYQCHCIVMCNCFFLFVEHY